MTAIKLKTATQTTLIFVDLLVTQITTLVAVNTVPSFLYGDLETTL